MLKTATKTVWFMHTSLSPVVPVSLWQTSATPRSTVLRMSLMRATAHILRFDFSLCFKSVLQCLGAPQLCRPAESQVNKRRGCSSFYQCLDSGLSSVSLAFTHFH